MLLEDTLLNILKKLDDMEKLMQLSINALTTKKAVAKFLNKSDKTIDNYIKNDVFKKDIHYVINGNDKIEFLPFGILEFKNTSKVSVELEKEENTLNIVISDTSKRILKNLL